MMSTASIIFLEQQSPIVLHKLETELTAIYSYHNFMHTLDVMEQVAILGELMDLNPEDLTLVKIAALYHDIGFLEGPHNHEARGCQYFLEDARSSALSTEEQAIITGCIMATRMPQKPHTPLEALLCDADLDYLGRPDFLEKSHALFLEKQAVDGINPHDWALLQQEFLAKHRYHTVEQSKRRPVIGPASVGS